jgi:sugar phosphate isomerase/epimerase
MKPIFGRREFLGVSLAVAATSLRAAEPSINFPTDPRQRLAVSSYPFRAQIISPRNRDKGTAQSGGLTLPQFGEYIVSKLHVSGIEPWGRHFESVEPDYVQDLSRSFKQAGLRVVNITADARVRICGSTPEDQAAGLEAYRKWVDAAVILGSPSIRVHLPRPQASGDIDCAVQSLKRLAEYGARKNIVINLENDNPASEDPFRVVKVIETAKTPFLRALPDFCNSMQIQDDQEYDNRALRAMFAHAFNISHVKNVEHHGGKTLRVDVDQIFTIAKKAGYRGYFSMEWSGGGDAYEPTRELIEASLKNLS